MSGQMKPVYTPDILNRVAERIARYPELSPAFLGGLEWAVATYRALPVGYDMLAIVFLSAEGAFFSLDVSDERAAPEPCDSTWSQLVTLRLASKTYPVRLGGSVTA